MLTDGAVRVAEVNSEEKSGTLYDIQGHKLDRPQMGINIIRMSDGTTRKVLVK